MTLSQPILLAGVTGYLGSHLFNRLPRSRIAVVGRDAAMLHTRYGVPALEFDWTPNKVRAAVGDLTDGILVHLVGGGREGSTTSIWSSNIYRTEQLIALARSAGIQRAIFMSGYGVSAHSTSVYYRTKALAERLLRDSMVSIVFRSSFIVGAGDELTPWIWDEAASGEVRIPGSGRYRIQPVWISDVVEMLVQACERGDAFPNSTWPVLGDPVPFRRFVEDVARITQHGVTIQEIDIEDLIRLAVSEDAPDWSLDELGIMCADYIGTPREAVLGVPVRSYAEILRCLKEEFRQQP